MLPPSNIILDAHAAVAEKGIQVRTTLRPLEFVMEATDMGYLSGDPQNSDPSLIPGAPNMTVPQLDEMT